MNRAPRLPGSQWALRVARWLVLALIAATLLAVLSSLVLVPAYVRSHRDERGLQTDWTPAQRQAALAALDWHPDTIAWFFIVRSLVAFIGYLAPGLLILRRKSHDWFGLYVAVTFIVAPAVPLVGLLPGLEAMAARLEGVSWQLFFILFYFFPDGRFVPRWTRWLLPLWVGYNLVLSIEIYTRFPWLWVIPMALVLSTIASQVYRYFRRSDPVQRQQTKLVVLALVVTMVLSLPLGPFSQRPSPGQAIELTLVLELSRLAAITLIGTVVPVAFTVAVLRYRLWDIDLLIRRTLIYTVLTGLLALAYVGSVVVLEGVLRGVVGGDSPVAIVLSTLIIFALFGPLRERVQRAIDRRFFRRKYDAARTLAAFGAQARDETDLGQLSERLAGVVHETMQPVSVDLWLRPPVTADHRATYADGSGGEGGL